MIFKLRAKFIVISMIMIMAILIVAFTCNYAFTKATMYEESVASLHRTIENGTPDNLRTFIVTVDNTGTIYQQQNYYNDNIRTLVNSALNSKDAIGEIKSEQLRFIKKSNRYGTVIAFTSTMDEVIALDNMMFFSIVITGFCAIAFLIISIAMAFSTTKPIAKAIDNQKRLISDASHELKTPITAIIASTDVLLTSSHLDSDEKQWVNSIKTSAEDMSFLIKDMLELNMFDESKDGTKLERIDLSELVVSVCLNYETVLFEQGKQFNYSADSGLYVYGNTNMLRQLIKIFLDNACKYSNEKGTIDLALKYKQDKAILTVRNSGDPIPPEEIERIFERFYRVDKVRSSKSGSGLGLSIAKRIAETHNTRIGVSSDNEATLFSVTFKTVK